MATASSLLLIVTVLQPFHFVRWIDASFVYHIFLPSRIQFSTGWLQAIWWRMHYHALNTGNLTELYCLVLRTEFSMHYDWRRLPFVAHIVLIVHVISDVGNACNKPSIRFDLWVEHAESWPVYVLEHIAANREHKRVHLSKTSNLLVPNIDATYVVRRTTAIQHKIPCCSFTKKQSGFIQNNYTKIVSMRSYCTRFIRVFSASSARPLFSIRA